MKTDRNRFLELCWNREVVCYETLKFSADDGVIEIPADAKVRIVENCDLDIPEGCQLHFMNPEVQVRGNVLHREMEMSFSLEGEAAEGFKSFLEHLQRRKEAKQEEEPEDGQ